MTSNCSRILIIDDDRVTANVYRRRFEKAGYEVEVALDGQSGFYRLMQDRPQALILDLLLPRISGVEILKKVRAQKQFHKLAVVVLTNLYLSDLAKEASETGADRIFNKATTSPQQITAAVYELLGLRVHQPEPSPPQASASVPPSQAPGLKMADASLSEDPYSPAAPVSMPASGPVLQPREPERVQKPEPAHEEIPKLQTFQAKAPETLTQLRKALRAYTADQHPPHRDKTLADLIQEVHRLTGHASVLGLQHVTQISSAVEALLWELREKPNYINLSTDRTLASAIDFLGVLLQRSSPPHSEQALNCSVLAVDDNAISRQAVTTAINKVGLKPVVVGNAGVALQLLRANDFAMAILDVQLPDMDGFELCTTLRSLPRHQQTPVVFVTILDGFADRVRSIVSGGNDFINKPFPLVELGVKALVHIMSRRYSLATAASLESSDTAASIP